MARKQRRDSIDNEAHYLTQSAGITVMRDPRNVDRWVLDGEVTEDTEVEWGYSYAHYDECRCDHDSDVCSSAGDRMDENAPKPTARDIMVMLADAFGYECRIAL